MRRKKRKIICDINVVPYIDVMLVLLVIFIITAPLLSQGVEVNLPNFSAKPLPVDRQGPIIVTVDQNGRYYLNLVHSHSSIKAVDLTAKITDALIAAKKHGVDRPVLVRGDCMTAYGKIVQVMAILQRAGVSQVGLVTEDPNESRA